MPQDMHTFVADLGSPTRSLDAVLNLLSRHRPASLLLWYPDSYRARDMWTFAATSVASSALADVIREFVIRR